MNVPVHLRPDETFVLNLGPQHPATHGVLRVKLTMDGEYIVHAEPVLGYIHRMHEKLAEAGTFAQFMPNTARMDYLHALAFNHGWALVVEKAAGIEVPERAEYIRVITVELNRSYSLNSVSSSFEIVTVTSGINSRIMSRMRFSCTGLA